MLKTRGRDEPGYLGAVIVIFKYTERTFETFLNLPFLWVGGRWGEECMYRGQRTTWGNCLSTRGFLGGIQVLWLTCKCLYWLSHLTGHSFLCVFVLFYTDLSFGLELTNWAVYWP